MTPQNIVVVTPCSSKVVTAPGNFFQSQLRITYASRACSAASQLPYGHQRISHLALKNKHSAKDYGRHFPLRKDLQGALKLEQPFLSNSSGLPLLHFFNEIGQAVLDLNSQIHGSVEQLTLLPHVGDTLRLLRLRRFRARKSKAANDRAYRADRLHPARPFRCVEPYCQASNSKNNADGDEPGFPRDAFNRTKNYSFHKEILA